MSFLHFLPFHETADADAAASAVVVVVAAVAVVVVSAAVAAAVVAAAAAAAASSATCLVPMSRQLFSAGRVIHSSPMGQLVVASGRVCRL